MCIWVLLWGPSTCLEENEKEREKGKRRGGGVIGFWSCRLLLAFRPAVPLPVRCLQFSRGRWWISRTHEGEKAGTPGAARTPKYTVRTVGHLPDGETVGNW